MGIELGVVHLFVSKRGSLLGFQFGTGLYTECARTKHFQYIGDSF
jgi:hypothetical protein